MTNDSDYLAQPNFCPMPWDSITQQRNGDPLKPCCYSKNDAGFGTTPHEYFNSTKLKEVKQDLLAGNRPDSCAKCYADDDAGSLSYRQKKVKEAIRNDDFSFDAKVRYIDIEMHSTCNLACNICGSWNSSKWYAEDKKYSSVELQFPRIKPHNNIKPENDMVSGLLEYAKDLKFVSLIGGEPFYSKMSEHLALLDQLYAHSPNAIIQYTTNGTIFPEPALLSAITRFKNVVIVMSMDGIGRRFEYGRWPAKWDEFEANFNKFAALTKEYGYPFRACYTVSIFSLLGIPESQEWIKNTGTGCEIKYNNLNVPEEYNLRVLPDSAKQAVTEHMCPTDDPVINGSVNFMNNGTVSATMDDLWLRLRHVDKGRERLMSEELPLEYKLFGMDQYDG